MRQPGDALFVDYADMRRLLCSKNNSLHSDFITCKLLRRCLFFGPRRLLALPSRHVSAATSTPFYNRSVATRFAPDKVSSAIF